jgi:hypothetical protein
MSNSAFLVRDVPDKPLPLDEVIARWPILRQSDLSKIDDCELAALFSMRHENGWTSHPAARGTIEHRVFAECLREMQRNDSEAIPSSVALAILKEKLKQVGVKPEDRVRVPLRELPDMEMAVRKWANDNTFTIRNLIDVERRLECQVPYRHPTTGELIERTISGQLDALIQRGVDEVTVIDWKGTWALPPRHDEENMDGAGLSYLGYFQQRFYALLVMSNFESVNAVVLREFYQRRSEARGARVTRQDLPACRDEIAMLVEAMDAALASGAPPKLTIKALEKHGHWKPSPGAHCKNCHRALSCPLDDYYTDGGIRTIEDAERLAAVRAQARAVDKRVTEWCKGWVDNHGPIRLKHAKGRRVLGYRKIKGGQRFEDFTPEGADRPATQVAYDPNSDLAKAMRESVAAAREERGT